MDKYKVFTIALPDTDEAAPIANRISSMADYRFNHKSGRPWLFSRQIDTQTVLHSDTPNPIAIIGSVDLNEDQLHRLNTTIKTPYQLQKISKEVAGSFLVFGSIDGMLYANGPAFQSKRLFSAVILGVRIISDRADLLAELGEFNINPTKLGLRMVRGLPNPADGLPVWDEIDELPGWEYLTLSSNGHSYQTHRWWNRPSPNLDRNEAALGLREALRQSVQARVERNSAITCDLSGGLDSTPICYFASSLTEQVYAHTYYTDDPGGQEDLAWAKRAIKSMPMLRKHQVFSNEHMPDFFENLTENIVPMDFPSAASGTVPRLAHMLRKDKELGASMHLNGIGGDHLLRGVKLWNHSIARKHPLLGWKRARAEDSPEGISAFRTFRELINRHSYSEWLMQSLDLAFRRHEHNDIPRTSDWSVPISAPDWLTPKFSNSLYDLLSDVAKKATPLDETHAGHFDIQTVLHATALTRAMEQTGHFLGIPYEAPLMDDHVVNAVLAAKHEVRDTPIEWKPLMKTAMAGLLPADYLRRTSKIGGAPQAVRGFAKHHEELSNLWQSSGIFDYEIIDQKAIRENTKPSATAMPSNHISTLNNIALFLNGINS